MVLVKGSTGSNVKLVQHALGIEEDGIFGPVMLQTVKVFQAAKKLVVDGIVGPATIAALGITSLFQPIGPLTPPWGGEFVLGYDVAHYQKELTAADWRGAYAAGVRFMYPKAVDGVGGPDLSLATFKRDAKAAGILSFAGYGFNRFSLGAAEQATALVHTTGGVDVGELPHVIDDEWSNSSADKARYGDGREMDSAAEEHIYTYLSTVEELSKVTPWLYTSAAFFRAKNPSRFARFPLILADYSKRGDGAIPCPAPWPREAMRQYSGSLSMGHAAEIDGDRFLGTLDQLMAYVKKA